MALLQHRFFPRSMFDMDQWVRAPPLTGLSTLDLFDPFDELDHTISRNLNWLSRPDFLNFMPLFPKVPQKYRISMDCSGFSPNSIKTEVKGNKLIVTGKEETKEEGGGHDYSIREFRKSYDLPSSAEHDKMVSFMTAGGNLIIELPLKETKTSPNADLYPHIVDNSDGTKSVCMKFVLPTNVDPAKANVMVKDRDLIFRVEDKVEKPDKTSRYYYYKRTTLPENTEFDKLKCEMKDNNQISISAPLNTEFTRSYRTIPIEHREPINVPIEHAKQQQQQQQQQPIKEK